MPGLLDLHSRLSDLKFGKDRPGGGNSGEPYIKIAKEGEWSPNNFDDGIVPFGAVTAGTRTLADTLRITKFFLDAPKGALWLAHQVGLQLSNPQLEHKSDRVTDKATNGQGVLKNVANFVSNEANKITNDVGTTRIYNPLGTNTLAQVAGSAFGEHFVRHGMTPVMEDADKYENVVRQNNEDNDNRLVNLAATFSDTEQRLAPIAHYKGGPNSFNGIGHTTIKRADRVDTFTSYDDTDNKKVKLLRSFIPINMLQLQQIDDDGIIHKQMSAPDANNQVSLDDFNFRKKDFREFKNKNKSDVQKALPYSDYENQNMEKRIGIARARTKDEDRTDYTSDFEPSSDKINALGLFYSNVPDDGVAFLDSEGIQSTIVTPEGVRDLVKFRIKAIDNDNPDSGVYMVFRAFLNNIDRRIDAQWNEFSYVGRGESFYSYNGFKSVMSFDFTICAMSRREMKPLYQKLNYLYSTLTPDYKNNKMRGNLVELTIGDYIHYQPGVIASMFISVPEEANWEIALSEPDNDSDIHDSNTGKDKDTHELPMMLKVGINFYPIHDFLPQKSAELPFFGIDDRESTAQGAQHATPKNWTYQMNNTIKTKH